MRHRKTDRYRGYYLIWAVAVSLLLWGIIICVTLALTHHL